MRVLLVEDHEPTLRAMAALLRQRGHEVDPFLTVDAALDADLADVALIDLHLGERSGLEVVARFASRMPCVMLTVSDEAGALVGALGLGARGYLLKSDPPELVLAALEQAVAGDLPLSAGVTRHLVAPLVPHANRYSLHVDLASEWAELFDPNDHRCTYRSPFAVSLLYTLAVRWSLHRHTPNGAWIEDERLAVAVWGREHELHGSNNLNVLIHRVRSKARGAGLEEAFVLKRPGNVSLDVGAVHGV
jgi:DNA-binding response OmpR family regulator